MSRVPTHRNWRSLGWAGRIGASTLGLILILGTIIWIAGARAKSSLMEQYPAPGQLVNVDDYKMHIYCVGRGDPTVVLAAGLDDFSVFWSLVQPSVGKFTRACSFDRAGLGWSQPSSDPRTAENMVQELHTLLANAGLEGPYIMVGHSFGGAQIRLYAYSYPGEVAGMVLVDAAPDDLFQRIPTWAGLIEQKLRLYRTLARMESFGLLALAPSSIPNRGLPDSDLNRYRATASSAHYWRTAVAENGAFEQNLAQVRAARVDLGQIPVSVISRGYWEPIASLSDSENQQAWRAWQAMQSELADISPLSRFTTAKQSEHNVHLQQPQLVVDAIHGVLEEAHK